MAIIKEWVQDLQPMKLYFVLTLTTLFFLAEFIVSHLTHSLTLLMDSYFTLCNIVALLGYIFTVKYTTKQETETKSTASVSENSTVGEELTLNPSCQHDRKAPSSPSEVNQEKKLKNTFGWARIDVMTMLIRCVFLGSLSFSIVVESLQTLVHIGHLDEMHHSISVLFVGVAGLLMNFICYVMIGGYNFHQGSFLYITNTGEVFLDKVIVEGEANKKARYATLEQRQSVQGMVRDSVGSVFVIMCAFLVYWTNKDIAKLVDPVMAVISATSLMIFSFPFMKESCLILLQTIPGSINIEIIKSDLLKNFPDIANIHDFHIWQLSATKIISTVHIIFKNPELYSQINKQIENYFSQNGISHVTIQPEFYLGASKNNLSNNAAPECLMQCQKEACKSSHCCPENLDTHSTCSKTNEHQHLKTIEICDDKHESHSNISSKNSINNECDAINKVTENKPFNMKLHTKDKNLEKGSFDCEC